METEVKKIPYLNLKAINEPYEKEIKDAINKVVNSGWYLQGEAVKRFEKSDAQCIGTEYCSSCANGTDALKLILMGELAIGMLQKGDEVIPCPLAVHIGLLSFWFSPRSVRATMFRVLVVLPVLLVSHTSTRLMVMPVVRLGSFCIQAS